VKNSRSFQPRLPVFTRNHGFFVRPATPDGRSSLPGRLLSLGAIPAILQARQHPDILVSPNRTHSLEVFTVTRLLAGRLRWALILFTFLISSLAYLDRVNISIAASSIKTEYALSNIQLGWVFSAFVLGYALFQAPGGRVADKFGN
jgi:ribosomal protein L34